MSIWRSPSQLVLALSGTVGTVVGGILSTAPGTDPARVRPECQSSADVTFGTYVSCMDLADPEFLLFLAGLAVLFVTFVVLPIVSRTKGS